jgi:DnaJ-class molecular chaperone
MVKLPGFTIGRRNPRPTLNFPPEQDYNAEPCPDCDGSGEGVADQPCSNCNGSGANPPSTQVRDWPEA